ncbi:peptidoglycan D,D-transpeptidase FtsI family protein [Flindersiella endophytica]
MNRPIRRIALAFMVLFFALLANVNYVQVWNAPNLNAKSGNKRVVLDEYARERGPILVGEGEDQKQVAFSVPSKKGDALKYQRKYAQTDLYGHITGYYSSIFGRSQIERSENGVLSGNDDRLFVRRMVDLVTNKQPKGGGVQLTINPKAQAAAANGLGSKIGAVVALDPKTGKVLAMVSNPSWDPSPLASHDVDVQNDAWQKLLNDKTKAADNRALQYRYPPGSTFKLVTSAAALESGQYKPETVIPAPAELDLPLTTSTLNNWQRGPCVGNKVEITLEEALQTSCNTAFGDLGIKLGADRLREQAEKFGFNDDFGQIFRDGLLGVRSQFPKEADAPQTALSAIGQFDVQATPLQMAMVTAAIANDGEVMRPYVVDKLISPTLDILATTDPEVYSRAISASSADQLTQMMEATVNDGTAKPAKIDGVRVAGKTGTAQSCAKCTPYAWFVSFAPADNPTVAVAVVIEKADVNRNEISGGKLGAPIAKSVMEAVIEQ